MKINDIKTFIGSMIDKDVRVPVLMVGGMGLGKSKIIDQLAKEKGMRLIDLRLAQMEACDLIGMPYKSADGKTEWAKPGWWPNENERCIILLDEVNRAPTDVRQAVFQLVLDRKLHTHTLPKGCYVHAAINPDNGEYQVETLDKAMLRRFCVIEVTPDVDVWLTWAKTTKSIDDSLTKFVAANRGLLFIKEDFKVEVKPTPDSYRMLNELLTNEVIPKEHQSEIFRGLIGNEASVALGKFLEKNFNQPVSGKEILENYKEVKEKVKKQTTPENYATVTDLATTLQATKTLDDKGYKHLTEFTFDLPKESQMALIAKVPRHIRDNWMKDQKISKLLIDTLSA